MLLLEYYYIIPLWPKSENYIIGLQTGASDAKKKFWHIYSDVGLYVVMAVAPIVMLLYTSQRPRLFYYISVLAGLLFVMNVSKLFYHNARPFWQWADVEAISCSSQFGNPSGHSMFSLGAPLIYWLDYNSAVDSSHKFGSKTYRVLFLAIAITLGITVGYSRMFLGVHSIDQVFFGWSLGLWLAYTYHNCLRDGIMETAKGLIEVTDTAYTCRSLECTAALVAAMGI